MWCMNEHPTAGCAVYKLSHKYKNQLIVESSTFGNLTYTNAAHYNPSACSQGDGAEGCMLWKQSPPSLLDTLIKMFMEPGSVPVQVRVWVRECIHAQKLSPVQPP